MIEEDIRGGRFFKLRSMSRKDTMEKLCEINSINLTGLKSKEYFEHVFEHNAVTEHIPFIFASIPISYRKRLKG